MTTPKIAPYSYEIIGSKDELRFTNDDILRNFNH